MILYMHPVSATSRPVRLLIAEYDLPCEQVLVDLMTGAHLQEPYASMNPNRLVPMLDDDGFTLTEASAILKYLADKFDLPVYPKPLQARSTSTGSATNPGCAATPSPWPTTSEAEWSRSAT